MTDALLAGDLPLPPRPDYLRHGNDADVVAHHDRPQAHRDPLRDHHHALLFHGRRSRSRLVRLELVDAERRPAHLGRLQQAVLVPWHRHGLVLPGAVDPEHARQFPAAADDRRARRRLPAAQPVQLVSHHRRRHADRLRAVAGGVDTGWTFYTPYSTMFSNSHVFAAAAGVFVVGFASIATGVNFIATTHMLRAPGMTWFRLPLFVWAIYATSIIMVLATPVLAISLLLVIAERSFGLPIFDPANGGDPLLFQHLFWFYSHPAVYIMVLPAMGVVSEIIPCFARRRIFGYDFMVYAMIAIAGIGFFVWGHHMFVSGQSPYASLIFSFLSFIIAVPSAIKVFNWTASLYRGQISFEAPMLYALGFVGLVHDRRACPGCSWPRSRSTSMSPTPISSSRISTTSWSADRCRRSSPDCTFGGQRSPARLYPESWAQVRRHPDVCRLQHDVPAAVLRGLSRHAPALPYVSGGIPDLQRDVLFSGAAVLAVGLSAAARLFRLVAVLWPARAGNNPWRPPGLEWTTTSPPPPKNFDRQPRIDRGPYDYHAVGQSAGARSARDTKRAGSPMSDTTRPAPRALGTFSNGSATPANSAYGFSSPAKYCSSAR